MKNKDEIMGVTITFIVTLTTLWVSSWNLYNDVAHNYLFIFLFLFAMCVVFGVGIPKLFKMKKKERFITDD